MLRVAAAKQRLTKVVIKKGGIFDLNVANDKNDRSTIDNLLLKESEVYYVPESGELLSDADLDVLLDRYILRRIPSLHLVDGPLLKHFTEALRRTSGLQKAREVQGPTKLSNWRRKTKLPRACSYEAQRNDPQLQQLGLSKSSRRN